jgi:hypothetical protein
MWALELGVSLQISRRSCGTLVDLGFWDWELFGKWVGVNCVINGVD